MFPSSNTHFIITVLYVNAFNSFISSLNRISRTRYSYLGASLRSIYYDTGCKYVKLTQFVKVMSVIDLSEEQRYCLNNDTVGSVRIVERMCEIQKHPKK